MIINRQFVYRNRIKISREDMALLRAGRKKCTIRLGRNSVASAQIMVTDGANSVPVRIINVESDRCVKDLTDREALAEGFQTRDELIKDLEKYYRRLDPEQPITIIYFEPVA